MAGFDITIYSSKVIGSNKTNFVYCFTHEADGFPASFFSTVTDPNALDVRFYEDSTKAVEYQREIGYYSSITQKIVAWVQIPSLSSSTDQSLYCETGGGTTANSTTIWSVHNSITVQHFNNNLTDSLGNGNDPTFSTVATYVDNPWGGRGLHIPLEQYAEYPTNLNFLQGRDIYAECWIKVLSYTDPDQIMSNILTRATACNNTTRQKAQFTMGVNSNSVFGPVGNALVRVNDATNCNVGNLQDTYYTLFQNLTINTWHHFALISEDHINFNIRSVSIWVDGVKQSQGLSFLGAPAAIDSLQTTVIGGANTLLDPSEDGYRYFLNADLAELRVYSADSLAFDEDWIKTQYNQTASPSTFSSVSGGEVEVVYKQKNRVFFSYREAVPGSPDGNNFFEGRGIVVLPESTYLYQTDRAMLGTGELGLSQSLESVFTPFSYKCMRMSEVAYFLSYFQGKSYSVSTSGDLERHELWHLGTDDTTLPTFTMEYGAGGTGNNVVIAGCIINRFSLTLASGGNGVIDATFSGFGSRHQYTANAIAKNTNGAMGEVSEDFAFDSEPYINHKRCNIWLADAVDANLKGSSVSFSGENLGANLIDISTLVNSVTITGNNGVDSATIARCGGGGVPNTFERGNREYSVELNIRKKNSYINTDNIILADTIKSLEVQFIGSRISGSDVFGLDFIFPMVMLNTGREEIGRLINKSIPLEVLEDLDNTALNVFVQSEVNVPYNAVA